MNQTFCELPCPACRAYHLSNEGITIFTRSFECSECGTYWEDTWCCDCDDECPNCGHDMTSLEILTEEIIEEAVCT